MDYDKFVLTLASIFFGWILAQFTGIAKDYINRRRIKKCLLEELSELRTELERTLLIYSRQLQIHAIGGIDNGVPIALSNHIFKNYYKDAVLSLNESQRISFQMIHSLVATVNTGIDEHRNTTKRIQEKHVQEGPKSITAIDGQLWGQEVIAEFHNAAAAIWHIRNHLENPSAPDLSRFTERHEQYLKYLQSVEDEIQKLIDGAKTMDRKDFEKIYNPESFVKKIL